MHNISNNTISIPFATASALATVDSHVTTLGTSPLATSTQASSLLSNITNLGTSLDVSGLYALLLLIVTNLQLDPVTQVKSAASDNALTKNKNTVTSNDSNPLAIGYLATYNNNLGLALASVTTATTFATQSNANTTLAINAVNTAIASFHTLAVQWNADGAIPSSGYSVAEINNALYQLKYSLSFLLTQQPIV